jgi:hypothetical protein
MRHALQGVGICALGIILSLAVVAPTARSQEAPQQSPQQAPQQNTQEAPQEGINQIKLTEAQVKSFISAQPDLAGIAQKLQKAGDAPDAALQAELDEIAKKHGFSSFSELDDVAANISIVMSGLDTQTGQFTDPVDALKKELESVKGDTSIPDEEKKQLVDELSEAIKTTPPVRHRENVDLVKAHREEIEKALQ